MFYAGTPNGGVWKTDDAGRTWRPIFDHEPVASIGAVVVSPSDPNIIYVGTGEQNHGDGVYKSTDAGATWTNVGLRDTRLINAVIVDPRNPDIVVVAAMGDSQSGAQRGIYKSTDGGKSWNKTLFKDAETGIGDLTADPDNPSNLYATLWRRPADPFDPGDRKGQDAWVYKSTDEGATWKVVEGKGLPSEPMGLLGIAVAPGTSGQRVYTYAKQGLYRSEDGGANWIRSSTDPRVFSSGYISEITVDPKNANVVYAEQTSLYRSTDGGKTFEAWVGAPSGDDYHVMWINPLNPQYIILGVDQGAMVSVNGGQTWSSWYNQPTGQFYHVSTDNQYPYNVYGAQQDSGTARVASRSTNGQVTYRDWAPVGGFEFCYIEADPLNPNYVYAGGWYGTVLRYDRVTGQIVHVFARTLKYRTANMAPIAFSPQDPHSLYVAAQYVLRTKDGGLTWKEVSPDLTEKPQASGKTPSAGEQRANVRRAVISTMSFSRVKAGEIWVGTGNGLVQLTRDGKRWENVTIPNLSERAGIVVVEASPHDPAEAYVVTQVAREARTPRSIAPAITARPGKSSAADFPPINRISWSAKILAALVCFSPEPLTAFLFPLTTAITGNPCSSIFPSRRSPISPFTATISSLLLTAVLSGSSTTFHRFASSTTNSCRPMSHCCIRSRRCEFAGTLIKTRRFRPKNPPRPIRPTARSSIIS